MRASLLVATLFSLVVFHDSAHSQPRVANDLSQRVQRVRALRHMHHTTWRQRDGLPVTGITSLRQSSDGYLWLGTNDALYRFDGVRFVRFDATNTPELKSDVAGVLTPLMLDRAGSMWISRRDGGLVTYKDSRFRVVVGADADRGMVTSMAESDDGTLWLGHIFM